MKLAYMQLPLRCLRLLACVLGLAGATAAIAQDGLGSTLNLKDADINSLITTVSDITGRNFIVDPRVKGKVTVLSSSPMSPDEIYGVFLSVLQVHGFAAVPSGPVIKIVPEVGAKQDGGSYFDFGGLADDEIVTRVLQIDNVPAAQLVPILRPLVPQYGHLAAYSPSNMLIVSDRAANVERLTEIIRRIDHGGDSEIEVIRLAYASATDVAQTLSGLLANEQKKRDPSAEPITLLADARTNSLLLSGDHAGRVQLRALIAHLDIPLEDDGDTQVIYLSYANAETLAPILEGYVESQGGAAQGSGNTAQAPGGQTRIVADPDTNALVITAAPKIMRGIRSVIAQLDIRRAQVLVEAILAEVSISQSRQLGVDLAVLNDQRIAAASILDPSIITSAAGLATDNIAGAAGLLRQGINIGGGRINENGTSFALLLNALYGDGETNVLSTPSLVTMDNEEAEISVGQEVPFLTGSFSNNNTGGGVVNPFQTIERRDVGLTLGITPQINAGDNIQLTIRQESSSISAGAAGAVDLVTNKRTLDTTVMVGSGDILVLGGLIDDNVQKTDQKVPILGDIPLLGILFRSTSVSKSKQNLMIFLRSTILRDRATADVYTRRKYDRMRDLQTDSNRQGLRIFGRTTNPVLDELSTVPAPASDSGPTADQLGAEPKPAAKPPVPTTRATPPAAAASSDERANQPLPPPRPASTPAPTPAPALQGNEPILETRPPRKAPRGHLR